jgi:hypothetical protein
MDHATPAVPVGVCPPMFAPSGWVVKTTCVEPAPIVNWLDDAPSSPGAEAWRKNVPEPVTTHPTNVTLPPNALVKSGLFEHVSEPEPEIAARLSVTRWIDGTGVPKESVTWTIGFGASVPVADEEGDCVKARRSPKFVPIVKELLVAGVGPPMSPVSARSVYVPARLMEHPWNVA